MEFRAGYSNLTGRPIWILHVDDEPADLEITRIFLKREGKANFEITSVLSAEKALEKLENEHFDVVIADYKLSGMNGIELLDTLRKRGEYADTPFILFTGNGGAEVAREVLKKGGDRYIIKNGDTGGQCNALARAIRELMIEKGKMREDELWEREEKSFVCGSRYLSL
jgi:CheY-like chemotaxis protein